MDFKVSRLSGSFIDPCEPTPQETLNLSRIDRLPVLRCNARTLHVFGPPPPTATGGGGAAAAQSSSSSSISKIIKEALSKALVPYYPLAGRLKEEDLDSLPLVNIECTGEGVWFVEAFANCTLEHVSYFEDITSIPFDKLLPPPLPNSLPQPLVLMQVTEFEGGSGFVMGLTFCHSICDGLGAAQFLNAIGEFARGLPNLTRPPVWHRHFLSDHPNHQNLLPPPMPMPMPVTLDYQLEQANIDISLDSITQIKNNFHNSQLSTITNSTNSKYHCSTFEVIAASLWKHRTQAIFKNDTTSGQLLKLVFFANCRELMNPPLPKGFYGNCFFPVTVTTYSNTLINAPIYDVVKLIQEAKLGLPLEFAKWCKNTSEEDPFAPPLAYTTLFLSEWGRLGFNEVDYGQGKPRQVVPMQGSSIIPVAIVGGSLPYPKKGVRLMTWCVDKSHLEPFLLNMSTL